VLRSGDPAAILDEMASATRATHLYFNRSAEPEAQQVEAAVSQHLRATIEVRDFPGDTLFEPGAVRTAGGEAFRVFSPFWRACQRMPAPTPVKAAPGRLPGHRHDVPSERLSQWRLRPAAPDWAVGLRNRWHIGETSAARALDEFIDQALSRYPDARDRPDLPGTSALSPHLHFGELSPRQVWHAVRSRSAGDSRMAAGAEALLRQLAWREFFIHILNAWPRLQEAPFQTAFERFPWRRDPAALAAWQHGLTGYPMVDAGMRELWATGWMHNRVRMLAASFLVKHLLIDWREGEAWFWDTLVDADLANNVMNWQWAAGCGVDAAPWFRIFNPVLQGRKFDPEGAYVRRWLPELAGLPARFIHEPWKAPLAALRAARLQLGADYPLPIVDHDVARARALAVLAGRRGA
jgi:deoxyribodipyrimidine photo-lyase